MARYENALDLAKSQVALRALRYGHFPSDIFDEYGWDMLLHLFIASIRKQTIYSDNLINMTSKNWTVGERWLRHLVAEDMVHRDQDVVMLTPKSLAQMETFHGEVLAAAA